MVDWSRSPASSASDDGVVVALGLPKPNQMDGHERVEEGEGTGPERRLGVPLARRIRRISMAVTADSGEGFLRPGGDLSRDLWGKWKPQVDAQAATTQHVAPGRHSTSPPSSNQSTQVFHFS
jgi:hypothetical protein